MKIYASAISIIAISWSIFQLATNSYIVVPQILQRSVHVMFASILIFLTIPLTKRISRRKSLVLDIPLAVLSALIALNIILDIDRIHRHTFFDPLTMYDWVFGLALIVLVLEITRRSCGVSLTVLTVAFLLYGLIGSDLPGLLAHKGISLRELVDYMYLSHSAGIYGIPIGVCATYVYIFIIFSTLLEKTGASKLFMDAAFALTGSSRGGPAKVSVVASSLFGTLSGSAVANVVATGSFTIPLMKKVGYKPHFAGAVEAVASTGGQIVPPVMGAGAFVMAELTGIPYLKICIAAICPSILYYAAVFIMVHLEAVKTGLKGLSKEQLPSLKETIIRYGHIGIPVLVLLYFLLEGYTPTWAGFTAVVSVVIVSFFRKATRTGIRGFLSALEVAAKLATMVAAPCAAAGIIIAIIGLTGFGLRFSGLMFAFSGGNVLVMLFLLMVTALILGMGMPTTAAYITVAVLEVPLLIMIGVDPLAAHMFAFYFACLSVVTPPVAVAVYAGAGIAGSPITKTAITATQLAIAAFIVPYMFVYAPALLLIGALSDTVLYLSTALLGIAALAMAAVGYGLRPINIPERIVLLVAAILLIFPEAISSVVGAGLVGASLLIQKHILLKRIFKGFSHLRTSAKSAEG